MDSLFSNLSQNKMECGEEAEFFTQSEVSENTNPDENAHSEPFAGKVLQYAATDKVVKIPRNAWLSLLPNQTEGDIILASTVSQPEKALQQGNKLLNIMKADQQQTNPINTWTRVIPDKVNEGGSKKRYGSQDTALGVMTTCPSPATPLLVPSRSSFSDAQNCFGFNNIGRNSSSGRNRLLHDYVPGQLVMPGISSKVVSSKWEDAEKWLNNMTNSPSHPKSKHSPAAGSTAASLLHGGIVGKGDGSNAQVTSSVTARVDGEMAGGLMVPPNRYNVISSDSEVPTSAAHEYRVLVRCTSQNYKPTQKIARKSRGKHDAILNGTLAKNIRKKLIADQATPLVKDVKCSEVLARPEDGKQRWMSEVLVAKEHERCACELHQHIENITEDKYPDTMVAVVETWKTEKSNLVTKPGTTDVETHHHGSTEDVGIEEPPTINFWRDMATQITPVSSTRTSSRCTTPISDQSPGKHNIPTKLSASSIDVQDIMSLVELERCRLAKLEIRDLPAGSDQFQCSGVSNWSTREEKGKAERSKSVKQLETGDSEKNPLEARAAVWEETQRTKYLAKYKREEDKIQAWENHQKAKAEAEMKKLEVRLERLRSHATEKIMNKLAVAHRRAEEMRAAAQAQHAEQIARILNRATHIRKIGYIPAAPFGICFS